MTSAPGFRQLVGDPLRGLDLLQRQLGVGVQMRVEGDQLIEMPAAIQGSGADWRL